MFTHTAELPTYSAPTRGVRRPGRTAARMLAVALVAALPFATRSLGGTATTADNSRKLNAPLGAVVSLGLRPSHNRRYQAEIVETDSLDVGRQQRWTLHVTRRNHRRLANAGIVVKSWAPETGELSTRLATSRYVGGGNYRLDGVYFPRAGWWNVALVIDGSDGVDSVAFNVILPPR